MDHASRGSCRRSSSRPCRGGCIGSWMPLRRRSSGPNREDQSSGRTSRARVDARRCVEARHRVLHGDSRSIGQYAARVVRHVGASRILVRRPRSTSGTCSRSARRSAAIARAHSIDGPLFIGIDTHALSEPACATALEVLAANGVDVMLAEHDEYTPTPAVSHAILSYNRGRTTGLADGIVITPSHNPPEDGGFKYNPPNGGPARHGHVTELDRGPSQ